MVQCYAKDMPCLDICGDNVVASHERPCTLPGMCRDDALNLFDPTKQTTAERKPLCMEMSGAVHMSWPAIQPAIG